MKSIPLIRVLLTITGMFFLTHCATTPDVPDRTKIRLENHLLHSFDGDQFPYRSWMPKEEPELVIIGVHGISGAAADYKPLGSHLLSDLPRTAIYAAETRGQGNDPIKERRGHINDKKEWFNDLVSFTHVIRKRHPNAKIVWCGESMGSLIVLHTYAQARNKQALCDAIILASPIVNIRGDFPKWKEILAHTLANFFPKARVSLESLSGKEEVRVTKDTIHEEQATKNSYHIERHTLHLLSTLGKMIRSMNSAAQELDIPVLVLHGGKDVFSDPKDVERFFGKIPEAAPHTRKFYPESFHLLFHDHQSELVVSDITTWLKEIGDQGK
ncbi:MAG: alpha/beta fold hydrolase [Akkermansiaceae bacterium]